jgi:flagellar motility protein MotE (MotC chaperone)
MNLHVPAPRLLPFTIAALAALLAVKTVDLGRLAVASFSGEAAGSAEAAGGGGVVAVAHAAVPDKPQAAAPVPAAPVSASAPAAPASPALPSRDAAGPPPISDGERAVLLDLRQRRQELDTRDAALSVRESILAAAEQKLQARVEELGALQKKLQDLEAARQQREEAGWQGLVKVYETMKPRDAAVIFNDLQMTVLLPLVDRMKDSKAAPVLAAMNPDKAREVTTGLAQMRTHPATANTSAQKGG